MLNSEALQASNPLIGPTVGETIDQIDAVLSFLQYHVFVADKRDGWSDRTDFGGYLVIQVLQDALAKQFKEETRQVEKV